MSVNSSVGFPHSTFPKTLCFAVGSLFLLLATGGQADLVGHWKFDESSGTVASNVIDKAAGQLTASGAAFVPGGISGNAVQLDRGQNGYVQVPPLPGLVASNFTVSAWVKLPPGDTTPESYLVTLHEAWFHNGFLLMLNQVGGFGAPAKASFYVSSEAQAGISTSVINDGNWHQIALTYDPAGRTALYVDGGPAEASIASAPTIERAPPLLVGGVYGKDITGVSKGNFSGLVDDLQIYSQALTEVEVEKLFRNPGRNLGELTQPVVITPNGGDFVTSIAVTLNSTVVGAVVHYTLDNSEPSVSSPVYATPVTLRQSTTIRARLFVNEFPVSDIVSASFTQVPPVGIEPTGGLFTNAVAITLKNNLHVGALVYTLDNTEPAAGSLLYTQPLILTNTATLKARIYVNGFPASDVATASYERFYAVEDGVPNDWRERYFGPNYPTDPRVAATADPDQDGWSNLLEFQNGTNPLDKGSTPTIVAGIQAVPKVRWNSIPGQAYRVLRKAKVSDLNWEVVLPAMHATETTSHYIDANAPPTAIYLIELAP